jgi:phage shock protein E
MPRMIIDVREPYEFKTGHVKGAINIPPNKLMSGAKELLGVPKDTELILYCRSGSRSAVSANILKMQGFTNITNGINKDQVEARYLK